MYAYDLEEVNLDFRKKHSHLRSKEFFKVFEKLENPYLKNSLNLTSLSMKEKQMIEKERGKFLEIWPEYESKAQSLKKQLESSISKLQLILRNAYSFIDKKQQLDSIIVQIIPFMKPHGKQECSNVLYLSEKKELTIEDYHFIIIHETLHLALYDLMMKYYFKYNYTEKMHYIEEVMINFIYFEAVNSKTKQTPILPRWLYLNDGETYNAFIQLLPLQPIIKKNISKFIESAIKLLGVDSNK